MKKIISVVLILTMSISWLNTSYASAFEGIILSDTPYITPDTLFVDIPFENDITSGVKQAKQLNENDMCSYDEYVFEGNPGYTHDIEPISNLDDFTFNTALLTSFNTTTAPTIENGANEPKFSYNTFLDEEISDYSGELTLNFEDLVLDGVNGLDLRIGRTYQSVASNIGEKSIIILPNENGYLGNYLVNNSSTYLLDRYTLGIGWIFSFPSVQIVTEYIPEEIGETYYYDEESELFYHSGNGSVYQVEFTPDETDSNLKGYFKKDIQFNRNDTAFSNGQVSSYYSLTLPDKTKQYFASDGRLLGIVDRFSNTIKFEHALNSIANMVPDGNFDCDDEMWISSQSTAGTDDAIYLENIGIDSTDGYVMYFKDNPQNDSYIISRPIQVEPQKNYEIGIRVRSKYGDDVKVELIGYDTAYNLRNTQTMWIKDYLENEWYDYKNTFTFSSSIRYVMIKITPEYSKDTHIDYVKLDKQKPLISKITDTIGRTVEFEYSGDMVSGDRVGNVTLTVNSPGNDSQRVMVYDKGTTIYETTYMGRKSRCAYWYLIRSNTEGTDGALAYYTYEGGSYTDSSGENTYHKLYYRYDTKNHSESDGWANKMVLNEFRYKDRKKVYEYEPVRKHMGDDGYYDTLRIKKKYDMYTYVPDGTGVSHFKGEVGAVNYSYGGIYNGNSFNNETGYPNHTFDDETQLNEQWTVTKAGKTTDTTTFSNCEVVQKTSSSGATTIKSEYTNHFVFKGSPSQIKITTNQNGFSKDTYILYTYNNWGGVSSETKEIDEEIKNNSSLLEKYTTEYQYNPDYHYITKKSYYNNVDSPRVQEKNIFNSNGLLISTENAVKEKINYYYENSTYPFLVTKTVQDDPMGFHNLMGGDRIVEYIYDSYGLYPLTISEVYDGETADTEYVYDYITGDVLRETLPDGSLWIYAYYSDGKIKYIQYPLALYTDNRWFCTVEYHTYNSDMICDDYNSETPTYDVEEIKYQRIFADTPDKAGTYYYEVNFYDAVGNLRMNQKLDLSKVDTNNFHIKYNTKYYYDNYDRLIREVDHENHSTTYDYDGFDRVTSVTDSEGNIYNYSYDSVLNKMDLTFDGMSESADRHIMTQYFDLYGNVTENIVYKDNSSSVLSEIYEYDLNNNIISYTNANGNKTQYLYDAKNRLKETILPNGVKATSNYSAFNKPSFEKIYDEEEKEKSSRVTFRNEKGDLRTKFFSYNHKLVDSDMYSTDEKGRITSIRDGENTKNIIYDQLDHPLVLTSANSQIHRRYNWYGELGSASTTGNVTESRYGYDALGNPGAKLQNNNYEMYYAYSGIGKIMQSQMPSGREEFYTYTPNGNLDTIVSDGNTFDYDYYDTGLVKSITYPGGLKTAYEYDNINRITKVSTTKNGSSINIFEYEYDNNGNTTKEIQNGAATTYSYDNLDRLVSVTYSDGLSVAYEYDALNNRTKEIYSNGDVKDYVYDEKYQLKEVKLNEQTTDTFTYNESGAVVTHNNKTYTYDEWDKMSGYSDGTDTYAYKYDANGIRTQKNDKQYIIDINNNVVAETDGTGAITNEIIWGHQPLARKINGSWYYYIYNAHGDVVGLVNNAGTVVNSYAYTPWGEIRSETETVDNPIKYGGEYYDDELNMIYLRARYYNPKIGRFTSLDIEEGEISNPLDMNRYVYCRNNPIKYVDPSGRSVLVGSVGAAILYEVAPYIATAVVAAFGAGVLYYKEHTSNKSKSNLNKHQEGQARKARDAGGEKGDSRRTPRKDKKK